MRAKRVLSKYLIYKYQGYTYGLFFFLPFISRRQQKCTYDEGQDEDENDQQYIHHPHLGTPHLKGIKLTLYLLLKGKALSFKQYAPITRLITSN